MHRVIALTLCIISLAGCQMSQSCQDIRFERLKQTDQIKITNESNATLRIITEKSEIRRFTAFAMTHDADWGTPVTGTPIAMVRANFYAEGKFIGDLGVGSNFLTAQGCGYFQSRGVAAKDWQIIMELFGVKDPYVSEWHLGHADARTVSSRVTPASGLKRWIRAAWTWCSFRLSGESGTRFQWSS